MGLVLLWQFGMVPAAATLLKVNNEVIEIELNLIENTEICKSGFNLRMENFTNDHLGQHSYRCGKKCGRLK